METGNKGWAEDLLRLARQARQVPTEQSTTGGIIMLIELAEHAVNKHNKREALIALASIKQAIEQIRPLVDTLGEREYTAVIEYMTTRRQNLELQLIIAKLINHEQAILDIQSLLDEMTTFFDTAINDLDPQPRA